MKRFLLAICLQIFCSLLLAKPIEILMWHSFAGSLEKELSKLVHNFHKSQPDYHIKMLYKGEYNDALTSFAAAFRAHQPPDLIQVFEVGTATMLSPEGVIKPLDTLMREASLSLDTSHFLPAIRDFYSKDNRLQAMPFNTSVPVIFYNADLLAKVGVKSRDEFPKTWQQLEVLAKQLQKMGVACVYTSAYSAWIHLESFSALHGLEVLNATQTRVAYNNPAIRSHLERLKDWQSKHYFEYGGRGNDASVLFTSGRCAMFSQSSGAYKALSALVPFKLNIAPLPIDSTITQVRHNNVVGGAALWAISGLSKEKYRGIGLFYQYLAKNGVQKHWYQHTGYIPIRIEKVLNLSPTLKIAQYDLSRDVEKPSFLYKIPQNQIRTIHDEALEAIFSGIQTPVEAMSHAENRANFALKRFSQNTGNG